MVILYLSRIMMGSKTTAAFLVRLAMFLLLPSRFVHSTVFWDRYCRFYPQYEDSVLLSVHNGTATYICPRKQSFQKLSNSSAEHYHYASCAPNGTMTYPSEDIMVEKEWFCSSGANILTGEPWFLSENGPEKAQIDSNGLIVNSTPAVWEPWFLTDLGDEFYVEELLISWAIKPNFVFNHTDGPFLEFTVLKNWGDYLHPTGGMACTYPKEYPVASLVNGLARGGLADEFSVSCNFSTFGKYVMAILRNAHASLQMPVLKVYGRKPCERCNVDSEICKCEYGVCSDSVNEDEVCICSGGYTGKHCETEFDACIHFPCRNNASCGNNYDLNKIYPYVCYCPYGYSGKHCETEIDECDSDPCSSVSTCVNLVDQYECKCPAGYTGQYCELEIDECINNVCQNNATCEDRLLEYNCQCNEHSTGKYCEHCIPDSGQDLCMEKDMCEVITCLHGGTCIENLLSCVCAPGYTGSNCETNHECVHGSCNNGGSCLKSSKGSKGRIVCFCAFGYVGETCEDRNPDWSVFISKVTAYNMMLHWMPPLFTEQPFIVVYRILGQSQWLMLQKNLTAPRLGEEGQVMVDGLQPDTSYEVVIEDNLTKSEIVQARTRGVPLVPGEISIKNGDQTVALTWEEIAGDHDSISLMYCNDDNQCETEHLEKGATSLALALNNNENYTFIFKVYQEDVRVVSSRQFNHHVTYTSQQIENDNADEEPAAKSTPPNVGLYVGLGIVCGLIGVCILVVILRQRQRRQEEELLLTAELESELESLRLEDMAGGSCGYDTVGERSGDADPGFL